STIAASICTHDRCTYASWTPLGVLLSRNIACTPQAFLATVKPFREDLVVAVECMFTWYWLADLCAKEGIAFVLGHALYMRAIHGGKAKNDRIDAHKIAALLRGGMIPMAYVYPHEMRATRDSRAPAQSPDAQTLGADRPHPEYRQPVQSAAL